MNIQELSDTLLEMGLTVTGPGVEKETLMEALVRAKEIAEQDLHVLQVQAAERKKSVDAINAILKDGLTAETYKKKVLGEIVTEEKECPW